MMSQTHLKETQPFEDLSTTFAESDSAFARFTPMRVLGVAWIGIAFVVLLAVLWTRGNQIPVADRSIASAAFSSQDGAEFDLSASTIPQDQILRGGPAKDGIPAILKPQFVPARAAIFLKPDDRVIGVAFGKIARAYPLRILNYHEIVNDRFGDTSIAVTYCPLCDSVCVFDRNTPLGEREFGVSGLLYNSNVLMYDRGGKPESLWSQLKTTGVSGPGREASLKTMPVQLTTWKDWQNRYPETEVQTLETGFQRDYSQSPYGRYFSTPDLMFPVNHKDARLPAKTRVLGIWSDQGQVAIPETLFTAKDSDTEFASTLDGLNFTVRYSPESRTMRIVRADPGLQWMYSFWFAWAAFHPQTSIQKLP